MTLKEIKDWFKTEYDGITEFEQCSINKIDKNLDKAICFYKSKRNISYINALGLNTYSVKPLTVLIRFAENQDYAEIEANKLYNFFDKKNATINSKMTFFKHLYENPIYLGTDDKGIIEYSLEIDLYYEREG